MEVFEDVGERVFCVACDRILDSNENTTTHVHDFQKYDLAARH